MNANEINKIDLTPEAILELGKTSLKVRETMIKMATRGGCFLGASLSAADLIVYLYKQFLSIPSFSSPDRDFLFLSKGHDVPALYGTFVELGLMDKTRLDHHLKASDHIYWHPNTKIPGVEFYSGSLGHLLPVAVGYALDLKIKGKKNRVVVIVGDGELNEGSNWEALLIANAYQLSQLTVVVDRNEFQANVRTEDLIPMEPLDAKFESFGCKARTVDGHSFQDLHSAFSQLPLNTKGPSCIIAKTVRGKGLPSIEARADRWFCNFTEAEVAALLKELHGEVTTDLTSETLVVR